MPVPPGHERSRSLVPGTVSGKDRAPKQDPCHTKDSDSNPVQASATRFDISFDISWGRTTVDFLGLPSSKFVQPEVATPTGLEPATSALTVQLA